MGKEDFREKSYWLGTREYAPGSPLSEDIDIDVAVIGGGFTGLSSAYFLKKEEPGLKVAVLESQVIGFGASGRNAGFSMTLFGLTLGITAIRFGKQKAQKAHHYMEKAVDLLRRAISREKMPHGYLFVGIPGVGKRTTVRALTRALNCGEQNDGDGCGKCRPCRQIMGGNFPDFEYIEPDGQKIKIEQIRALNQALAYKPAYGKFRVTLIHQAETMTKEGANAFLKTLEEPPKRNILILCVAEPLDLLPTILSRCQKVRFRPIPSPLIAQWIDAHYDVPHESAVLAGICEGSLG